MLLLLTLSSPALATLPHLPAAEITRVQPLEKAGLERAANQAAAEFGVPAPLILAIAWEASHWNPEIRSVWGGYGLFDLREGDQDPALEHAGALLEVDPNTIITDWRLQVRGAAAILADQGQLSNGGELPAQDDLIAWWDAVRAFSGREEPVLQDQYARYIFETVNTGATADTAWGVITLDPVVVDLTGRVSEPPPASADTSLAYQFYDAASCNYSDYSRGSGDIDMVVVHTVQGSYSGCYSWFANCDAGASAHYVVRSSDGQITQMVKEADVGWHAGDWDTNLRSVGIEHEGYVDDCSYYTTAMYEQSAALTADIASRQGVTLSRSYIIGHNEVPGCDSGSGGGASCHTDPGDCWDWDYYMDLLNGETSTSGGEIIGAVRDSDIYNGANLIGASVWIAETGETTTVASDGYYRFGDVPFGTYTMHASYPGYAEGTCTKTTSSSQDWCSIALFPDSGGTDTGSGTDTDTDTNTDSDPPPTDDTAPPTTDSGPEFPGPPGDMVMTEEASGGCGCATPLRASGAPAVGIGLLGLGIGAGLLARRRAR